MPRAVSSTARCPPTRVTRYTERQEVVQMSESFISQISTKRTQGQRGMLPAYYVRVPREWAEAAQQAGQRHVQVREWRPGSTELVLTPLSDEHVAEYRAEKRRRSVSESYYRRRREGHSSG